MFDDPNFVSVTSMVPMLRSRTTQSSIVYVGGNIVGGSALVRNISVTNVGDDSLEVGGFQTVLIENVHSVNANRAGIVIRYSQRPLDPSQTIVTIRNYQNVVTGDAISASAPKQSFRGSPLDIFYDADGDVDPRTGLQMGSIYPLAFLTIEDSTTLIDGTTSDGRGRGAYDGAQRISSELITETPRVAGSG